ncbi:hypothetical protein T492DRAFT_392751 [Pavlovales sp. CCMP2436]|nr:hypothetical protein T492DRAFT_392751 [Pavlovales sp. CCMP2436]
MCAPVAQAQASQTVIQGSAWRYLGSIKGRRASRRQLRRGVVRALPRTDEHPLPLPRKSVQRQRAHICKLRPCDRHPTDRHPAVDRRGAVERGEGRHPQALDSARQQRGRCPPADDMCAEERELDRRPARVPDAHAPTCSSPPCFRPSFKSGLFACALLTAGGAPRPPAPAAYSPGAVF